MTIVMMTELALCFFAAARLLAVAPVLVKTLLLMALCIKATLLLMTRRVTVTESVVTRRAIIAAALAAATRRGRGPWRHRR